MIRGFFERLRQFFHEHVVHFGVTAFCILFVVVVFSKEIFNFIEAGHAGVLYRRFAGGTQVNRVYGEGMHILFPWDKMTVYDVRIQRQDHTFSVLSSNGLTVGVTVSIRFRPKIELLGVLHKEVGTNYAVTIVIPEIQALIRDVFGQYTPEELYTSKRSVVQQALQGSLDEIGEKYILLDDLLIESIALPPTIETAIEAKLTEEQKVLEMKFRLEQAKLEAGRRVIEAEGIAEANRIVSEFLSEEVLRFKGIDATLELAKSPNAKIVVLGDSNGLPLIYDSLFMGEPTRRSTNGVSPSQMKSEPPNVSVPREAPDSAKP